MEFVFAGLLGFVAFEEDNSASLVSSCEIVSRLIEFDGRYYVGLRDIFNVSLIAETSVKSWLARVGH